MTALTDPRFTALDITKFFAPTSGGIRTYLLAKAAYVATHPGLAQVVVVPGPVSEARRDGRTVWYRLRGPPIPTQHPYRLLLDRRSIRRIVDTERPDVIEVGSPYLVPWMMGRLAREYGIPLVWYFHTDFPRIIAPAGYGSGILRGSGAALAWRYVRRLGRLFDCVVAASEFAVADLRRHGVDQAVKIPLGVDLDRFHPRRREAGRETRRAAGLPEAPVAMYVGRLAREKNLGLLFQAWPEVHRRTGAHLVLVGGGPSRAYYQARSPGPMIHWLPFEADRDRLADLHAAADVYLAPGPAETFGLSALEALASGTPVVSVEGAVAELVRGAGVGAAVPPDDPAALAEAVVRTFESGGAETRWSARAYAEAHHRWEDVFDRLFSLYRSLTPNEPPVPR
ncbi:MAG: glycosyltransferase [Gemmatimonadales bacterium]